LIQIHPSRQGNIRHGATRRVETMGMDRHRLVEGQRAGEATGFSAIGLPYLRTVHVAKADSNFVALIGHIERVAVDNGGDEGRIGFGSGCWEISDGE
jgi:hypothetical protein